MVGVRERYLLNIVKCLREADRHGAEEDKPEGARYIQLSETLVDEIIDLLEEEIPFEKRGLAIVERSDKT